VKRLPIRLRLALAFALATALVLTAIGALLTLRLGSTLEEVVDDGLVMRAAELEPGVAEGGIVVDEPVDPRERFVQLLDEEGRVVAGTRGFDTRPILDADAVADARTGQRFVLSDLAGVDGRARILVTRVGSPAGQRVMLVGASLDDRDETVRSFVLELALIGPVALGLVSLLGYALATAALRPVESMRREAAAISASEPGRRLTLPAAQDEVRRLGETLNEMLARLESALERERGFVAAASHELRAPLAVLTTELELALRRPRSEAELERAARSAALEADRLARLADDLLLLARSDSGRLPLHREVVETRPFLEGLVARFAARARAGGRQIAVDESDGLSIAGDQLLLEHAVGNLLENALRHGRGAIHVTAARRDDRIELHVTDEGDGFPPAYLPSAFDRFSRADEARTGEGSGLGLTIAAAIAVAHGGSVGAANRTVGADVWLSIPVCRDPRRSVTVSA
jgi:two-component system, OmpR family, sensor kinase